MDKNLNKQLQKARYVNAKGVVIPLHHAFMTIRFGLAAKLSMIVLPIVFCSLAWIFLDQITSLWEGIFQFWMGRLVPDGAVSHKAMSIFMQDISMPFPLLDAALPSETQVWYNLFGSLILFVITFFFPQTAAPVTYPLRAMLLLQVSTAAYFMMDGGHFPYDLQSYIADQLTLGLYLIFLIPLLLAVLFYIFDFPLWWKCFITLLAMGFFVVALPFQYMLHAWVIHRFTLIFLPLLYFLFGVLLQVLMFITLYSCGMSWRGKSKEDLGRYA